MMEEHGFWWLLCMACVVWYSTITVYVAVRGCVEIRKMLMRLKEDQPMSYQQATQENKHVQSP